MIPVVRKLSGQPRISRSASRRETRRRLLVVCGAKATEPDYINGLKKHLRNPSVSVEVVVKDRAPSQVVRYALKLMEGSPDTYDEVWCVVDMDQFADLDTAVDLAARSTTSSVKVAVVVSNPCFELWLLLHFTDHRGTVTSFAQLKPLLKKHVPSYDKSRIDFEAHYAPTYPEAVRRARSLDPTGSGHRCNPSTNMWQLVDAMGWPDQGEQAARR